jgi:hypothetical protein
MAALPKASYGIDNLYLFPYYQTREQYAKATGKEPPEFDSTKSPKSWFDPAAAADASTRRSVVYENVIAGNADGYAIAGEDGKPMLEAMLLSKAEAATVNIPLKVSANEPGAGAPEVPVPLRNLEPEEYLDFGFGGNVIVHNRNFETEVPANFSLQDRNLLKAIAKKLGVDS